MLLSRETAINAPLLDFPHRQLHNTRKKSCTSLGLGVVLHVFITLKLLKKYIIAPIKPADLSVNEHTNKYYYHTIYCYS